eukprot:PITA_30889
MTRYYEGMYLNSNKVRSSWKHMGVLQEGTMQGEQLCKRFFVQGYGGQPFIKIQKHTPFEKWAIDFVGPIKPQEKAGVRYIITVIEYLTRWAEAQPVKDYRVTTAVNFLFKNVYHQKSTPYHPQANGTVEAFNKTLETELNKVCNAQRSDWDLHVPVVLWAYRTTCKKLTGKTPFRLVYGMEVVMLMEYIVPSLHIAALKGMMDHEVLEERLMQLEELEEEWLMAGFH